MNKHGYTRIKNTDTHGFTVIEILFVVALVAVLLAAIYPYLRSFHTSWQDADRRSDIIQNARIGMDKMVRELRWAGSFSAIQKTLVTFTDVDDNPAITYRLNSGNLERNTVVLAGPIPTDGLTFTYYDATGVETSTASEVKSVEISMTVSDPESKISDTITLASAAFIRSTPAGLTGEGYTFSKNADFSTEDTTFSTSDTFYIRVWTDQVDYGNLDYATCQLKKGGTKVNFNLTNNGDGTYTGSQDLSGFATGTWTVNMDVKDNNTPAGRYKPTPAPSITIE